MPLPIRKGVMSMSTLRIAEPNEKQKLFLKARNKFIAYGGA